VRSPCTICGLALNTAHPAIWKHTTFTPADVQRIRSALERSSRTVHPFNPPLRWLVRRLMEAIASFPARPDSPTAAATLRTLICGVLLESMVQMLSPPRAPQASVEAAIAFFRQHLDEPVHIPDLVRYLGFSRARTFELFKSQTGLTPNDYLQRLRIEKAQELLRATQRSVTAIALETGFSSGQYFCTVFRRYTGLSPAAYREANRPGNPARRVEPV
jgi:AraC-like DNA-binding protein